MGDAKTAVLWTEPRLLSKSKEAWSVFEYAVVFFPTLCELGHQGVSIYRLVFDRAPTMVRLHEKHLSVLMQACVSRGSARNALVAALRNLHGQLHHHLPDWLLKQVKFVNPKWCVPPDEVTAVGQVGRRGTGWA